MGAVGQTQDKRSKMIGLNNFLLITATWWRIIFRFVTLDFKWIGIKCIVLFHHLNWLSLENYLCSHEPDIVFLMCCYLNLNFWQHSVVFYGRKQGISIALKRTCFLHGGTKGYHLHWLLGICLFIPVSPVSTLVWLAAVWRNMHCLKSSQNGNGSAHCFWKMAGFNEDAWRLAAVCKHWPLCHLYEAPALPRVNDCPGNWSLPWQHFF